MTKNGWSVSVSGSQRVSALNKYEIYFQAGKLQMKSQSPKFPEIPTNHELSAKTATGNGNSQPEIENNVYSSSKKIIE